VLSERNEDGSTEPQQPQQDDKDRTKTLQITLQSAESSHKKRSFIFTNLHTFSLKREKIGSHCMSSLLLLSWPIQVNVAMFILSVHKPVFFKKS